MTDVLKPGWLAGGACVEFNSTLGLKKSWVICHWRDDYYTPHPENDSALVEQIQEAKEVNDG